METLEKLLNNLIVEVDVIDNVNYICTWTSVDETLQFIQDVVHDKDKFYVVDSRGKVFSFDITLQSVSHKQLVAQKYETSIRKDISGGFKRETIVDALMVRRYFEELEDVSSATKKF